MYEQDRKDRKIDFKIMMFNVVMIILFTFLAFKFSFWWLIGSVIFYASYRSTKKRYDQTPH
jgi:hypothetical protein